MDLDPAVIDSLNEELQPVFRLTSILSAGWPHGCPPGISNHVEVLNLWIQKALSLSTAECKRLADAGDPEMMYDFALRAAAGVELPGPDAALAERYWNKILKCPRSPSHLIGTAHAQLILFTGIVTDEGGPGPSTRLTDLLRVGAHAELAAQAGLGTAPNLLKLGKLLQGSRYGVQKEIIGQWKHFWAAVDEWTAARQETLDQDSARKVERPFRYKCAAPGCPIEASKGKLLRACGGKCEDAYKPHYCTKECQAADWKTHKAMCKPGLQTPKSEFTPLTASSGDPSLTIHRNDIMIGGGGVSVIPTQSAGRYTADVGGVKLHSSNLPADQMKLFAAAAMRTRK